MRKRRDEIEWEERDKEFKQQQFWWLTFQRVAAGAAKGRDTMKSKEMSPCRFRHTFTRPHASRLSFSHLSWIWMNNNKKKGGSEDGITATSIRTVTITQHETWHGTVRHCAVKTCPSSIKRANVFLINSGGVFFVGWDFCVDTGSADSNSVKQWIKLFLSFKMIIIKKKKKKGKQ